MHRIRPCFFSILIEAETNASALQANFIRILPVEGQLDDSLVSVTYSGSALFMVLVLLLIPSLLGLLFLLLFLVIVLFSSGFAGL